MEIKAGKGQEPPGRKLNVHIRYYPDSGEFFYQTYDGGNLIPVTYSAANGCKDEAQIMGETDEEKRVIAARVLRAVLHGLENPSLPTSSGLLVPPPSLRIKVFRP